MKLRSHAGNDDIAISLTPLIDVVFILLIFFMLASSFLDWRQVKVQALSGAKSTQPSQTTIKPVLILVTANGGIQVQGNLVGIRELAEILGDLSAGEEEVRFLIKPEAGVPIQKTMDVIGIIRSAGLEHFSLVE